MAYTRIMVAVDGSKIANLALMEAAQLSKTLQAKLCILQKEFLKKLTKPHDHGKQIY